MIFTKLFVNGSPVDDSYNYKVTKSMSENNSSSDFTGKVENFAGRNANKFQIGQEITIYSDTNQILTNPGSEPTLQFNFANSGTTIVDNINGYLGSNNSSTIQWVQGIVGSAIQISGLQAFNVFNTHTEYITGEGSPFSIMAWGKFISGNLQSAANEGFFVKGNLTTCNWGIDFTGSPLRHRFGTRSGTFSMTATSPPLPTNQWYHIAGTYNGSNLLQVYLNANAGSSFNTNGSAFNGGLGSISVGRLNIINSNTGSELIYQIDDARFYPRTLSQGEISAIYNQGNGNESINNGSQLLYRGILENVEYTGDAQDEKIEITGRDYTARLVDRTVEPEVYTNWEIGSIVRDIVNKYTDDITTSGVNTVPGSPLTRIVFNQTPVYDAVKQLANLAGDYVFYIDNYKDLKFQPAGSIDTNYTFNSGNTLNANFETDRESLYNQIWVYGDRYLDGFTESLTFGSPVGGSSITLLYNPHNTQVSVSGGLLQPGGVDKMTNLAVSGAKYLVNFLDKQIIFVSGTGFGNFVPTSGNLITVVYDRLLPVVKLGNNDASIIQYGQRNKVIVDKNIKDPRTAENIMKEQLITFSNPKIQGNLEVKGFANLIPSQNVTVNFPNEGINNQLYEILQATYNFNIENNLSEKVLTVKLNNKIDDITDTIKQALLDIKKIQGQDISDSDVITRFQFSTGSYGYRTSGINVYTRTGLGSSFIIGIPNTNPGGVGWGGVLGSLTSSGVNYLGDSRNALVLRWSGGYP